MINKISLEEEIIPSKGLSNISLGLHSQKILHLIQAESYTDVAVKAHKYRLYEYIIRDSLSLSIDIYSGQLVRIDLYNQFKGKYQSIGIGNTIKELKDVVESIYFDEHYILVGENMDLIVLTDYEDDIDSLEEVEDYKITSFTLELKGWRN